jgi:hypothetical protein
MYTLNQRPDASTKETLVHQTGLSQRVIRVWFQVSSFKFNLFPFILFTKLSLQNKRCKDKKKQNLAVEQELNLERVSLLHVLKKAIDSIPGSFNQQENQICRVVDYQCT